MSEPSSFATGYPGQPLQPQRAPSNGFGIAALVLGIITMVGFAIPFLNFGAIATGIVGLALGIVGLVVKFKPRGMAIAGVILSGLGLLLSIALVVVYAAAFTGAVNAAESQERHVENASPSGASSAGASSPGSDSDGSESFKNGVLTTPEMKLVITSTKIIPVGQAGNEYGKKPVIAFYYSTTNLTDTPLEPDDAFISSIAVYQDNDPNVENKLDVGMLPDEKFSHTQDEDIKKGGTVDNAIAYELDDTTTPVDLVASDDFWISTIGKTTYPVK